MTGTEIQGSLRMVRAQRADLWRHMMALEEALATPIPGRAADWSLAVHDALVDLAATFERHIAVTEGSGGLFAEVMESAPRLEGALDVLRREHEQVVVTLAQELRHVREIENATDTERASGCRRRLTELLTQLLAHRQEGADLVYEAYAVDIGVGD